MSELHKEWFRKADNDLLNVENNLKAEKFPSDTVCFHCHQVAEKYLKGFLTLHDIPFEKTHNLLLIYTECLKINSGFKDIHDELINLNNYPVTSRYPTFFEDIPDDEALEAYQDALKVRSFILSIS